MKKSFCYQQGVVYKAIVNSGLSILRSIRGYFFVQNPLFEQVVVLVSVDEVSRTGYAYAPLLVVHVETLQYKVSTEFKVYFKN
ncbi:hypothetical protein H1Q63_36675 [Desmonostoc muscorum CCALA 125]|nr:hypothetical protein [Desmonostoc muscorum CCALA 125]